MKDEFKWARSFWIKLWLIRIEIQIFRRLSCAWLPLFSWIKIRLCYTDTLWIMDSNLVFDFVIVKFCRRCKNMNRGNEGWGWNLWETLGIRVFGRQQCVCFLLLLNTSLQPRAFSSSRAPFSVLTIVQQCGASPAIPFPGSHVPSVCHLEGCLESHCFPSESPRKWQALESSVLKFLLLCEVAYLRVKGSVGGWPLGLSVVILLPAG